MALGSPAQRIGWVVLGLFVLAAAVIAPSMAIWEDWADAEKPHAPEVSWEPDTVSDSEFDIHIADDGRLSIIQDVALPSPLTSDALTSVLGRHSREERGTNHKKESTIVRYWDRLGIWSVGVGQRVDIMNLEVRRFRLKGNRWDQPRAGRTERSFVGRILLGEEVIVVREPVSLQRFRRVNGDLWTREIGPTSLNVFVPETPYVDVPDSFTALASGVSLALGGFGR